MIFWIYRKELREILREKRARSAAILGPMLSVALSLVLFGVIGSSVAKAAKSPIHYVGARNLVIDALQKAKFPVTQLSSVEKADAMLREGEARLVLVFPSDPATELAEGKPAKFEAHYDPNEQRGAIALASIQAAVAKVNEGLLTNTLRQRGIDPAAAKPLDLETKEVTATAAKTNSLLLSIIPYLVVLWAFYGGFAMASDIVAGEKERQTLETMLTTPVARRDVAIGKLLALITLCVSASLTAVLTLFVLGILNLPLTRSVFEGGVGLTPLSTLVAVAAVLPLAAMFGAMLLAISTYARNTREAQSYLAPASFLVLIPAVFSQIIGLTDAANAKWVNFVPILNVTNVIRMAMLGKFDPVAIAATIGISVGLAAIALVIAVRLFSREQVLTRI